MLNSKYLEILDFVEEYGAISIDIGRNLFYNTRYGYDSSRRALSKLHKAKYLKVSIDFLTDKKIYYKTKSISSHKLMLLNLYSTLVALGVEVIKFYREKPFNNVRADGFIIYKFNGIAKMMLLEIDINNRTKVDKFQKLYEDKLFQDRFGAFPKVLVINQNGKPYKTKKKVSYQNIYLNYKFDGLEKII